MKEENKLYAYYLTGVLIIAIIIFILIVNFISFSFWINFGMAFFVSFVLLFIFIGLGDEILNLILSVEYKNKIGFYVVRWKSKEFDEFVGDEIVDLYQDSCKIFEDYTKEGNRVSKMSDYSFMLLPIAKAYEGILKKVLVRIGLTKEADWESNPNLSVNKYFNPVGNNNIFEALEDKARDRAVPHVIYSTYQECRNKIFHYDSYRDNRIKTVKDAEFYKKRIEYAIEKAYETFVKK